MKKVLFILYQPYKWLVYFPFLVASTLFFGILAVILISVSVSERFVSYTCGAVWSRLNGYMTPMFVKVIGSENIDRKQSYVIVSNHQSHFDVFVLYGWIGIDFKWVMKQELRNIPVFGLACEKVGFIFIDRSNKKAALASLEAAKEKIVDGTSVVFFPEGTRSTSGELMEFKKGAFRMALDLQLPVLPLTIIGTKNILPNKTLNLLPGRTKMIIHKPIDTTKYSTNTIDEFMAKVKAVIQSGLDKFGK